MSPTEIKVELREGLGKEKSKKIRAGGKIPAVIYGHGANQKLAVDAHDFGYLESHGSLGGILTLKLEGEKKPANVIIKEVQKNPVNDTFLHIDFLKIAMDEAVTTMVPVSLIGEAPGIKMGGVLQHGAWELSVKALPADLPASIEVDVSALGVGDSIKVADLILPKGVEITSHADEPVVSIVTPTKMEEAVAEEAEEEVAQPKLVGEEEE
ncbi:MAG: 50S ribosomal protein L25 [Actinomycetota bacterium]|nr:50S ribosomal protein L25 [Actinomycetota bacterium]